MSKPLRLLLIEDSESDANLFLRLLMQAGFGVSSHRVDDAEGLRHALRNPSWDVIIADYFLPGFDAPGALRILQESGAGIPCIVVSGRMGEETAVEMMKSGAHDYLTKKNLSRLAPAVEREMAEAALRKASREAQEELRSSEERLALAVEATQIGTFDYYPQSGELIWSKLARRHYGVSLEREISFDTLKQSFHPDDRDSALRAISAAARIENGGEYAHEYRTVGIEDRRDRWLSSRGHVFFDEDRRAIRMIGVVQNVTEQRRMEQEILQAQKLESLGRLAGSIGHEFNNLFTVINGYTHLVLAAVGTADPNRESMEELSKAAMQASALTRRLVACSRRQIADPATIVLNEFVKDYENLLRRFLGENIHLELSLHPQAGAFRADPGQMGQVLLDLVKNAKDAMPRGGRLTIKTSVITTGNPPDHANSQPEPLQLVELSVSDTGTGITKDVQSHLFEPFFTTKAQGTATGQGLSTVYGIVVNQSRGNIAVTSEPGLGTTFTLSFPALRQEVAIDTEVFPDRISPRNETILLVDDEIGVRKYTRKLLERHGYKVLEAANGKEALSVAQSHSGSIHLLLTDLVMPMMGGVRLMESFTAEFPCVPVLFMTAYPDQIMRHWNAMSSYIQKPYNLSELLTQVRELLDRAALDSVPARNLRAVG